MAMSQGMFSSELEQNSSFMLVGLALIGMLSQTLDNKGE